MTHSAEETKTWMVFQIYLCTISLFSTENLIMSWTYVHFSSSCLLNYLRRNLSKITEIGLHRARPIHNGYRSYGKNRTFACSIRIIYKVYLQGVLEHMNVGKKLSTTSYKLHFLRRLIYINEPAMQWQCKLNHNTYNVLCRKAFARLNASRFLLFGRFHFWRVKFATTAGFVCRITFENWVHITCLFLSRNSLEYF